MLKAKRFIDLSTDARTFPTDEMWEAMKNSGLDEALGREDGTVNTLLEQVQEITGKESAILVPSCSMANLTALLTHTTRGDQVILEESSHIAWSEGWGVAGIAGLFPKLIKGRHGVIHPVDLNEAVEDERFSHRPVTTLLCLENTHNAAGGTVLSLENTIEICKTARKYGLAVHLDGARIFNASVALKQPVKKLVEPVDSVSLHLSKGLSALEGALLCGSKSFIFKASRILKMLGGDSMHKAGIIAKTGLIALNNMIERLSEDHNRARLFAEAVQIFPGVEINLENVHTNIVMLDTSKSGLSGKTILSQLKIRNIGVYLYKSDILRFVFHRHIGDEDLSTTIKILKEILKETPRTAQ